MTPLYDIIRVVEPAFLVNSSKRACRYETDDGNPLAPGYYFALWPAKAATYIYNRDVRYFGPFATRDEALHWQDRVTDIPPLERSSKQGGANGRHAVGTRGVDLERAAGDARCQPPQFSEAAAGSLARR